MCCRVDVLFWLPKRSIFDTMAACAAICMRCNMCTTHIGQRMRMVCVGKCPLTMFVAVVLAALRLFLTMCSNGGT